MKWNSILLTAAMFLSFSLCQVEEGEEDEEREEEESVARVLEPALTLVSKNASPFSLRHRSPLA